MQGSIVKKNGAMIFVMCLLYGGYLAHTKGPLWDDELAVVADVLNSASLWHLIKEFQYEVHAPGYWLLSYFLNRLSLNSEFWLRLPSVIMGAIGITAFARIAQDYLKPLWVWAFALYTLTLPTIEWHMSEARPHVFLFAGGALVLFYLHQAIKSESSKTDEGFFCSARKAVLIFAVTCFFHCATFFLIPILLGPFFFLYRKKFSDRDRFLGKMRYWVYPFLILLMGLFLYLLYRNIFSVQWGFLSIQSRIIHYTTNSFSYSSPYSVYAVIFFSGVVIFQFFKNNWDRTLKLLLFSYVASLILFILLEMLQLPFGKTKYSLYNMPTAALLAFVSFHQIRLTQIKHRIGKEFSSGMLLLPLMMMTYYNVTYPYPYVRPSRAPKFIQISKDFLQQNPQHFLITMGSTRNLTYYWKKAVMHPEQIHHCHDAACVQEAVQKYQPTKTYILFYKTNQADAILQTLPQKNQSNFQSSLIEQDEFGLLVRPHETTPR